MSSGGRLLLVVVTTTAVVLGAAGAAWHIISDRALDAVELKVGKATCVGTHVVRTGQDRHRAIVVRPGMRCRLPVTLHNTGRFSVRLEEAVLPALGAQAAFTVRAGSLGRARPVHTDILEPESMDARFELGRTLPPGQRLRTALILNFRPQGCVDRGTSFTLKDLPTVELRRWGRSRTVASSKRLRFYAGANGQCVGARTGRSGAAVPH